MGALCLRRDAQSLLSIAAAAVRRPALGGRDSEALLGGERKQAPVRLSALLTMAGGTGFGHHARSGVQEEDTMVAATQVLRSRAGLMMCMRPS
ncbi:hypothetical protein RHECNPAF_1740022 [Rhizobium etli CNPAF512]|nr:hypothetical protein RHECNPAF_1740022 [Rhizobium etli CNPAF512]